MWQSKAFILVVSIVMAAATAYTAFSEDSFVRVLKLKDNAEVSSQQVCLQDLVQDDSTIGKCRVSKNYCCHWSLDEKLERSLSAREIQQELSKLDFGPIPIRLEGKEVSVRQTRRALKEDEIKERLANEIAKVHKLEVATVDVTQLKMNHAIFVDLAHESDWSVKIPETLSASMPVKIAGEGQAVNQILGWVHAVIEIYGKAYVSKRKIEINSEINADNFTLSKVNILGLNANGQQILTEVPEAVRAKVTIKPGDVLTSSSIEKIPLVRLGDVVTIVLRSDTLRISTKGVVQQAAGLGDAVTVQLRRYNRTFRGKLIADKKVEVWL